MVFSVLEEPSLFPTLLKMGCYITPLGHYTILVIKTLQRELLITSMV